MIKYVLSQGLSVIILYPVFLIMSIVLFSSDVSEYGMLIKQETDAWRLGPIADIKAMPSISECPEDYEAVHGKFFGTNSYC
jgi:hypothetical protein